ncbi:MAG: hypothetical protein RBT75_10390 [Anaerolineae bacterium]|jgi:hypothetical protein|nr:hypothetical protein [Anaerolineae bacterium]
MKIIRQIFWGMVVLAVGAPAIGASSQGAWVLALGFGVLGFFWVGFSQRHRFMGLIFALCIAGIAMAAGLDVGMGWLLVGITAALAAWDLEAFGARMAGVARIEHEHALVRDHLRRLGMVCSAGLLLATLASFVRIQLSFGVALVLASIAVLGLGYVLRGIGE